MGGMEMDRGMKRDEEGQRGIEILTNIAGTIQFLLMCTHSHSLTVIMDHL
jgi:hypothetical protein